MRKALYIALAALMVTQSHAGIVGKGPARAFAAAVVDVPVAFDAGAQAYDANAHTSVTTSITVADNVNRCLVVYNVGDTVSSVTCGGSAFTRYSTTEFYYFLNPPTGANTVVINFTGSASGRGMGVMSIYGVNQTTPLSTYQYKSCTCGLQTGTGTDTFATAVGDAIFTRGNSTASGWGSNGEVTHGTVGAYYWDSFRRATTTSTAVTWSIGGGCSYRGLSSRGVVIKD